MQDLLENEPVKAEAKRNSEMVHCLSGFPSDWLKDAIWQSIDYFF